MVENEADRGLAEVGGPYPFAKVPGPSGDHIRRGVRVRTTGACREETVDPGRQADVGKRTRPPSSLAETLWP